MSLDQRTRVLRVLQVRGHVNQGDFLLPDVIDGGAPITRLGARILELREQGHKIVDTGQRDHKFKVYSLAGQDEFHCGYGHTWYGTAKRDSHGLPALDDAATTCPVCGRTPCGVEGAISPAHPDVVAKAAA